MAIDTRAKLQSAAWVGYPGPPSVLPTGPIRQAVLQQICWTYIGIFAGTTVVVELYGVSNGTSTATAYLLVGGGSQGRVFRRRGSGTPRAMTAGSTGSPNVFTTRATGSPEVFR